MNRIIKTALLLAVVAALLCGCTVSTIDEMYCLPKRSEDYQLMQDQIDKAMVGLEYCSPLSGENQQTVQMADLDGDGVTEYILYARGASELPLQILVFCRTEDGYALKERICGIGSSFDQVEYVQVDGRPGLEIVVGRKVSDQLVGSVSVYSFADGLSAQLLSASYSEFQTGDLNCDGRNEVVVFRPGETQEDNGVAEFYSFENGVMARSCEAAMSESVSNLKRIIWGPLSDGLTAVYAASAVDEKSMITDIFALVGGSFVNVSFSSESGTSVQTLRNYYVYAEDIDGDGVVELPDLIAMTPVGEESRSGNRQYLIRWYSMRSDGTEVDKMFTYHNFGGGWYLELEGGWIQRLSVLQSGTGFSFYLWDESYTEAQKLMTIYALTGQGREEIAASDGRIVLYVGESVIYAALLEVGAEYYNDARDQLVKNFHLIRSDWKTGET